MTHTVIFHDMQDKICIPKSGTLDKITIQCSDKVTETATIRHIIESAKFLHPNAAITVECNMIENIQILLPMIDGLSLRLHTPQDFKKFLDMDNHLDVHDTKNKTLTLIVDKSVEINNCKPKDLPLIWHVKNKDCTND